MFIIALLAQGKKVQQRFGHYFLIHPHTDKVGQHCTKPQQTIVPKLLMKRFQLFLSLTFSSALLPASLLLSFRTLAWPFLFELVLKFFFNKNFCMILCESNCDCVCFVCARVSVAKKVSKYHRNQNKKRKTFFTEPQLF